MKVALDLDGTLISCEARQSAVLRAALVHCGSQTDLSRVWELKREGDSTMQALVNLGLTQKIARRAVREWQRMIEEPFWLGMDSVLPGVPDVVFSMLGKGSAITILTARSRREWVKIQLMRLGLLDKVHKVIIVKPDRAMDAKADVLRTLAIDVFFGDTESDWLASNKAKVPFCAVSTGQRSASFLKNVGIEKVYENMAEAWNEIKIN